MGGGREMEAAASVGRGDAGGSGEGRGRQGVVVCGRKGWAR